MSEQEIDNVADSTDVVGATDESNLTVDDYNRTKESLDKATSKYVLPWKELLKKHWVSSFEELEQKLSQEKDNFITKEAHELDKFLIKNPEFSENSEELLETAKALKTLPKNKEKTLQQILDIASKTLKVEQETNQTNERIKKSRVTDWDSSSEQSVYTKSELAKLDWPAYDKALKRIEEWKAKWID